MRARAKVPGWCSGAWPKRRSPVLAFVAMICAEVRRIVAEEYPGVDPAHAMKKFYSARPTFCGGCKIEDECLGGCKVAAEACSGSVWRADPFGAAFASDAVKRQTPRRHMPRRSQRTQRKA